MNRVEMHVKARLFDLYRERTHLENKDYELQKQECGLTREERRHENAIRINILESVLPDPITVTKG